jgi:transposase-like protein
MKPVFSLPAAHQRRMRTSNALERVNQEIKRRTRVASLFPNDPLSCDSFLLCSPRSATNGSPEKSTST